MVPMVLEAPLRQFNQLAAEAGLVFRGGLAVPVMAAGAVVELWGPVVSPMTVGALGVLDTLKRQLLHIHR